MIFFAVLISVVVGFGIYASKLRFDLVSDDYYQREIDYQSQIDRLNNTAPFKSEISISLNDQATLVRIVLPVEHTTAPGFSGNVYFYRPSDAEKDFTSDISPLTGGSAVIDSSELTDGLWKVQLSWTTGPTDYYYEDTLVVSRVGI